MENLVQQIAHVFYGDTLPEIYYLIEPIYHIFVVVGILLIIMTPFRLMNKL
jgi:hypothetical protein